MVVYRGVPNVKLDMELQKSSDNQEKEKQSDIKVVIANKNKKVFTGKLHIRKFWLSSLERNLFLQPDRFTPVFKPSLPVRRVQILQTSFTPSS
jgi:hypothetical protein